MTDRTMLSLKEAAAQLGVHVETVRRWCRDERVPYYRVGATMRIRLDDLRVEAKRRGITRQPPTTANT